MWKKGDSSSKQLKCRTTAHIIQVGKEYLSSCSTHVCHHSPGYVSLKDIGGGKDEDLLQSHLILEKKTRVDVCAFHKLDPICLITNPFTDKQICVSEITWNISMEHWVRMVLKVEDSPSSTRFSRWVFSVSISSRVCSKVLLSIRAKHLQRQVIIDSNILKSMKVIYYIQVDVFFLCYINSTQYSQNNS